MFEQPQESEGHSKALIVGLAIGASVIVALVGAVFYQSYASRRDAEARRNLERRAREYAARQDYKFGFRDSTYVKGKAVVFNLDDNTIDLSHKGLPDHLRAESEDEIRTLVTVRCKQELEAYYFRRGDVNGAWGKDCWVQVIDVAKGEVLGGKEVYGYAPPLQEKKKGETFEAKHPDDQIVSYLTALPRAE